MNTLKIAFVDPNGLEYNGDTLNERGLGGSESAVISMARELQEIGFGVTVYNNCKIEDEDWYNGVEYRNVKNGPVNPADIVISVRSPTIFYESSDPICNSFAGDFVKKAKLRVLWMHDTFTVDDSSIEPLVVNGLLDEVWTLSDFHTSYITNCDHTGNRRNFEMLKRAIWQTRNGVNDYGKESSIPRDHNHFVFNAAYTKGMRVLLEKVWPRVRTRIQDARLTIIGGYYNFPGDKLDKQGEDVKLWKEKMQIRPDLNVTFTGSVTQEIVADIIKTAGFMLYPTEYPETFGISTLEALYHRTPVITANFGALEETAIDMACYKLPYSTTPNVLYPNINEEWQVENFVNTVVAAYENTYLYMQKQNYCDVIKDIATWDTIALQWKQHIYRKVGGYLPVEEQRRATTINQKVKRVFNRRWTNPEDNYERTEFKERKINIITTVRNGERYIEECMRSVAAQDYSNYVMYISDDASTDDTKRIISQVRDELGWVGADTIKLFYLSEKRDGAVLNQLRIMDNIDDFCKDPNGEICIILDGDDKLKNDPYIFSRLNDLYIKEGAKFTYGSCWSMADNIPLIAQDYPLHIKENKSYRTHLFPWNIPYTHLRTFSSNLIKGIRREQLKDADGKWMMAGGDTAMFYEMIERCEPDEIVAVKEIQVVYNDLNPQNDYKVNSEEQTRNAKKALEQNVMPKRLLIAIPTARYIEPETFKSIYEQVTPGGVVMDFQYFYGYNVDQVRNLIANYAIENNYDYLMCVDHDIAFAPTTVARLINHGKDVVGGIYRQRKPSQVLEVFKMDYTPYYSTKAFPSPNLFEVGAVGLGCALIKVDVLRKIGYPQFDYHRAIKAEDSLSEDVDFCQKARAVGYRIFVDPSIRCDHYGQSVYRIEN
jgi:glycosyltransferase involved in cell wall biosynthesis